MCLIAVAWKARPRFQLALIANRDEFHARPAAPAGFDPEFPDVYGGRDLQAGGSWLLASMRGRLAAVTNVRVGRNTDVAPRSRGALVRAFASGTDSAVGFASTLAPTAAEYGRFNLLLWDGDTLEFASNHPSFVRLAVTPGLHAMSNGAFDAPWPKSGHATRALASWLESPASSRAIDAEAVAPLFDALADTTPAPDAALPDQATRARPEPHLTPAWLPKRNDPANSASRVRRRLEGSSR